jgi:hypothetical protein
MNAALSFSNASAIGELSNATVDQNDCSLIQRAFRFIRMVVIDLLAESGNGLRPRECEGWRDRVLWVKTFLVGRLAQVD